MRKAVCEHSSTARARIATHSHSLRRRKSKEVLIACNIKKFSLNIYIFSVTFSRSGDKSAVYQQLVSSFATLVFTFVSKNFKFNISATKHVSDWC